MLDWMRWRGREDGRFEYPCRASLMVLCNPSRKTVLLRRKSDILQRLLSPLLAVQASIGAWSEVLLNILNEILGSREDVV